ncbi:MAG: hypothetical protein J7K98_01330 [Candidatus Aenigmarchaeota archaeon]|nr:hypothetical protein [Candidatus Aenigmarchaeota archaeon]
MDDAIRKVEVTARLSGIIFRKALMEGDFLKVYSRVLEILEEVPEEDLETTDLLEIFGDIGG